MTEDRRQTPPAGGLIARVEGEVEAGRLWRAREILQGAIRQNATDPVVLERYGRLLDRLGDRVEAGKYLFLSGVRGPEVDPAISLFLTRHGRGHLNDLVAQFPSGVIQAGFDALPPVVMSDLAGLDLPTSKRRGDPLQPATHSEHVADRLALVGCWTVGLVFAGAIPVGLFTMVRWLISLFG
jgi:hypothetical protein